MRDRREVDWASVYFEFKIFHILASVADRVLTFIVVTPLVSGQLGRAFPEITGLPLETQIYAGLGRSAAHLEFVQQVVALLPSRNMRDLMRRYTLSGRHFTAPS